jgi:hypothetical protein
MGVEKMAGFPNLPDSGRAALKLREEDVRGCAMPMTGVGECAAAGEEMVEGMRSPSRRCVTFRAAENAGIDEILIGTTAIRNRRKSLKTKGGDHF